MKTFWIAIALAVAAGTEKDSENGARIVESWVEAMNGLDGTVESVDALVSLYHDDALHIEGPAEHQLGTVTFDGAKSIRIMAERFSETYEDIAFRLEVATARETSSTLFHVADGPWGGESVAVQFSVAVTRREDGVRTTVPGAAFFRIQDGKIRRARLYLSEGERAEVEPLP